ncbi:thiol peroxidase [Nanchangia anserum]|uniref:Thiol peroxidase n=1 Tax=Nanchangia anserum TaxID=2692125 RepID=A0A8I0GB33_9ACTO|nr:thiol peroxidase [Nanchangia anserum]MBD3689011.1 thiol peroxidase [Nanchangia anserum]QOX81257.1 thiol peroxidase [Nanchangia anserum]
MSEITFTGNPVHTCGTLPALGSDLPSATLVDTELAEVSLADFRGRRLVLNIFPSVDTDVCAASVRHFNEAAAALENTTVLCISKDLPFALARFCGAEGIENVRATSAFRSDIGESLGVTMQDGPLAGLLSRCVIVADAEGRIVYTQQVEEITEEPDYDAALAALS